MEEVREMLTPQQAAEYLQVDQKTIYRYIKQGKILASRLGRRYRIPRRSIVRLLWTNRTKGDVGPHEYADEGMADSLPGDKFGMNAQEATQRFLLEVNSNRD